MKKISVIVYLLLQGYIINAQTNKPNATAVKMLTTFYATYITEVASSDNIKLTNKTNSLLMKKYCTARCIKRYYELTAKADADAFIQAQDSGKGDEKNITVDIDDKQKDTYYVSYIGAYNKVKRTIKLQLIKQGGSYKIDYLW